MSPKRDFLFSIAKMATGVLDDESLALDQFAKLVVIGELKEHGIEDSRNADTQVLLGRSYIHIEDHEVLVSAAYINVMDNFVWRIRNPLTNIYGIVLLGFTEDNVHFCFMPHEEVSIDATVIKNIKEIGTLENNWDNFIQQLKMRETNNDGNN